MTTLALLASMMVGPDAHAGDAAAHPAIAYKILTRPEKTALETSGRFEGSPQDAADGYIHLSTDAQLTRTADRHFAGQTDLFIAAVDLNTAGDAIKWERSPRSGMEFPHLYDVLQQRQVLWIAPLRRDEQGQVVVPVDSVR
ncbi:DUF952 domain-containing protein [Lysobacter enzymogenes]|uniref:DUF952 domain-containing protein n=1 Tax=Lysobacter enzymogenes TaxID=69 RepID=UPI0019D23675|nr:DUF952 domain-containing protein [Lysobacter enzymogenes]